jgi:hypothetical protein
MSNFHHEVLSSDVDPKDIVIITCWHDPSQETWEEFSETVKQMYPGEEQEMIHQGGKWGVRLRMLQKKSTTTQASKKTKK